MKISFVVFFAGVCSLLFSPTKDFEACNGFRVLDESIYFISFKVSSNCCFSCLNFSIRCVISWVSHSLSLHLWQPIDFICIILCLSISFSLTSFSFSVTNFSFSFLTVGNSGFNYCHSLKSFNSSFTSRHFWIYLSVSSIVYLPLIRLLTLLWF